MSAIFEDPGLAKIFAMVLLAIIGVLVIAVIILAFKKNDIGNDFWESIGFAERDDLVYRNKNIHELNRIDT